MQNRQNNNGNGPDPRSTWKMWALGGVAVLGLAYIFNSGAQNAPPVEGAPKELAYSEFIENLEDGRVSEVTIGQQGGMTYIIGTAKDGTAFTTRAPQDPQLIERLRDADTKFSVAPPPPAPSAFSRMFWTFGPTLLFVGFFIWILSRSMGGGGRGLTGSFGANKAKLLTDRGGRVTFDDVAGIEEAKQDLQEVVDFLQAPRKYEKLGAKIPKGVLLVGPPGTGKTLVARAVAGEAGVPFFSISGSDFVEMFVGVGASRVRSMFEEARKNAPCIIFIDEIDAVGRRRGMSMGGGNDEREQTLNQLLVEMDGFEASSGIIIIGATNMPEVLDPALLRPGRLDRRITVSNPDLNGREKILKVHMKKVPLAADVNTHTLARGTPGFSGADLANLVNEAALMAARRNSQTVTMADFENAKDKVMMGAERKSMVMSEDERRLTAYHEAGHAIAALHQAASDPIHKATIIPRGGALGMVVRLPERDKLSINLAQLKAHLVVAYGGRVAEQMIFGDEKVTSGAESDLEQATNIARRMVMEWGFSEKLGRVRLAPSRQNSYLGGGGGYSRELSEETTHLIEQEVKRITEEAEAEARRILTENKDQFETLAKALLEYETLSGEEINAVLRGEKLDREGVVRNFGGVPAVGRNRSGGPRPPAV